MDINELIRTHLSCHSCGGRNPGEISLILIFTNIKILKLKSKLNCVIINFLGLALTINFAQAWLPGREHEPIDVLPNIVSENHSVIMTFVLILFLFLIIVGFYKLYNKNKPLICNSNNLVSKLLALVKFLLFVSFNIFVLFIISYFVAFIFYFISSILTGIVLVLLGYQFTLDLVYSEKSGYILLIIYILMTCAYTKFLIKRNKNLNNLIIIAIILLVFIEALIYVPLSISA